MSELLPCPFCGERDDLEHGYGTEDREGIPCWVYCAACGAQGPWEYIPASMSTTIRPDSRWNNQRALFQSQLAERDAEIEAAELQIEHLSAQLRYTTKDLAAERQRAHMLATTLRYVLDTHIPGGNDGEEAATMARELLDSSS